MEWTFAADRPIYTQLVEQFKQAILAGELQPGEKIAAVRDMAVEAQVNPNTMQRALAELEREGLMYTRRTSGRYITDDRALVEQMRAQAGKALTAQYKEQMRRIGFDEPALLRHVKNEV